MALPTADEMLDNAEQCLLDAFRNLGDAQDWLRSDWRPVGSSLTRAQAERKHRLATAAIGAKYAINQR